MSFQSSRKLLVASSLLLLSPACSKSEASTPAPAERAPTTAAPTPTVPTAEAAPASAAAAEAKKTFRARCMVCHGEKGMGDGPGAAALSPKPRNYTDAAWQATVTDEQLKAVIVNGGAATGKSPIMPASPDLKSKPEVVDELVKIVRDFKT
jgi:mono/diheme cytochrome c family protein